MITMIKNFWLEEEGQDLIEYTLLLAFVVLVAAAIFIGAGQQASSIWVKANARLSQANSAATTP